MEILINGRTHIIKMGSSLLEIKKEFCNEANVVILNGFQTSEDIVIKENDELVFMDKNEFPTEELLERLMVSRHTPKVHMKVKKSKVGIAGLGGLGSNIAIMLARTGVGHLLLVDYDIVEPSNLNRQSYYISHLGMAKGEALKKQITEINPFIKVDYIIEKVEEKNIKDIFKGCNIVCEAFDNPESKAMLVSYLLSEMPKIKIVSASGMAGYESSNTIKTIRKMGNLYVCGDEKTDARVGRGLMAPRVSICAGHQANMVLRLILNVENVD